MLYRFFSIRGCPGVMISENGSESDGRGCEGAAWNGWRIRRQPLRELCAPAAQHQIGYAELLVNLCIAALKKVIADEVLTLLELYTCFLEIANLINQRPISRAPDDPEDGSYCYALMACCSIEPHPKCLKVPYDHPHWRRVEFVQSIDDSFWKR